MLTFFLLWPPPLRSNHVVMWGLFRPPEEERIRPFALQISHSLPPFWLKSLANHLDIRHRGWSGNFIEKLAIADAISKLRTRSSRFWVFQHNRLGAKSTNALRTQVGGSLYCLDERKTSWLLWDCLPMKRISWYLHDFGRVVVQGHDAMQTVCFWCAFFSSLFDYISIKMQAKEKVLISDRERWTKHGILHLAGMPRIFVVSEKKWSKCCRDLSCQLQEPEFGACWHSRHTIIQWSSTYYQEIRFVKSEARFGSIR